MRKNTLKILSALLIAFMIMSISSAVFAVGLTTGITGTTTGAGTSTVTRVKGVGNIIIGVIQTIGVVAAIIMLVFLGIKYVSAAPSEKAEIKKSAAIYVVGAVMLLGAAMIIGWVNTFVSDLNTVGSITTTLIHLA